MTGSLHLGHVANAAWTWGLAGALGGRVLLRLEDHDRGRWRREYEAAILDELDWLGLRPERPSTEDFRSGPCEFRQSDHPERYLRAAERLAAVTRVYACGCSRRELQERTGQAPGEEPRYDGHCRELGLPTEGRGLRVELPDELVHVRDAIVGEIRQRPAEQCGDLLARDREGNWTYQFCVVVDDLAEGVELVVRGADLLDSVGRQVLLRRLLGSDSPPVHAHHPLIGDAAGRKLSKSEGDACVSVLREAGHSAASVLGEAARLSGLTDGREDLAPEGLAAAARARFSPA